MEEQILNTVIIGSGPAGYTAAVYASRANLKPVLVSGREQGGQLTTTPEIGNWPGAYDAPSGFDLMQNLEKHAVSLGTKLLSDEVIKAELSGKIKRLTLASGVELKTKTVIIATGATARYLGLESESKYKGAGVSACATCDGFFFRGKTVAVIGGGSAAFVEALYLAGICNKVYLVHRRDTFRAEKALVDKYEEQVKIEKIVPVLKATVKEVLGNGQHVTGLRVLKDDKIEDLKVDGIFVAIGHKPATEIFKGQLELDTDGYVKVGFTTETSTSAPGVFAAGDCADKVYRQAITSAGQGCKAALDVEHYLL